MSPSVAQLAVTPSPSFDTERTLDLAALAQIGRGERVEIEFKADATQELFLHTLRIVEDRSDGAAAGGEPGGIVARVRQFLPEHEDLRQRFLFAETIGSYAALHDLLNGFSPAFQLFSRCERQTLERRLSDREVAILEGYRDQVHAALHHANRYLFENPAASYTADELAELNGILLEARERCARVDALLGMNLILEVEQAVLALSAMENKIRFAQTASDGTFLVDSEVMFLPTADLIRIVNTLFNAIGNAYVARHIDGLLLLAGRNLLISVVSFYAYYGKQQIYNVVRKNATTFNRAAIMHYIRMEIRELFKACKSENRLVLRRVMASAERQFEISVEALRSEAERSALNVVEQLLPAATPAPPPVQKTFLQRVIARLFR